MIKNMLLRLKLGDLSIQNVKDAIPPGIFRGLPELKNCSSKCGICSSVCPCNAISINPLQIDLGKCTFCGDCVRVCPEKSISFSKFHHLGTTDRSRLIIGPGITPEIYKKSAFRPDAALAGLFKKSLKLRQVSAAGCNSCEMELNACSNVNFDMGRFGFEFVASPRHADGIVITGPVSENMAYALMETYTAVPDPKLVIAAGSCAISGGVFQGSEALNRSFLEKFRPHIYIPGCPVHPLTVINALLDYLNV